ncbi:MAG: hypothetical protein ACRDD8_16395 [Bacteroidales bacterium]
MRRSSTVELEGKGSYYKKLNNSYDICDHSAYYYVSEKEFIQEHIDDAISYYNYKVKNHHTMSYVACHEIDPLECWEDTKSKARWYWDNYVSKEDKVRIYKRDFDRFYYPDFMLGTDAWRKVREYHNRIVAWLYSKSSNVPVLDLDNAIALAKRKYRKLHISK